MRPASGTVIDQRFRLIARVWATETKSVYRALDLDEREVCAVKFIHRSAARADRLAERTGRLRSLRHPNLPRFITAGAVGEGFYEATEWIEGPDLASVLPRRSFSVGAYLALGEALAKAIGEIHRRALLHGGIRPSRILLRGGEIDSPVLIGCGPFSAFTDRQGDVSYVAPEQARHNPEPRSDLYSLGAVLFHCLSGQPPFVASTSVGTLAEVLMAEAPRLRDRVPSIEPQVDELLASLLARSPEDRPASADALWLQLSELTSRPGALARSALPRLSDQERRILPVLGVTRPEGGAADALDEIRTYLRAMSSWVASPHAQAVFAAFGHQNLDDAEALAVDAALYLRERHPEFAFSIIVGASRLGAIDGELISRATRFSKVVGQIRCDGPTAEHLERTCQIEPTSGGAFTLTARRLPGDGTLRFEHFVGRDLELAIMDHALSTTNERGRPAQLIVRGAMGAGKSRLLREAARRLESHPSLPQVFEFAVARGGSSLEFLRRLIRTLLALEPNGATLEKRADDPSFVALLTERVADILSGEERERTLVFLAHVLGFGVQRPAVEEMLQAALQDPALLDHHVVRSLEGVLRHWGDLGRPLVLVIDDLHAMDRASAELLTRLWNGPTRGSFLMLGSVRSGEVDLVGSRQSQLTLGPLSRKATRRLIEEQLGPQTTQADFDRIADLSEGNPLFLEELLANSGAKGEGATHFGIDSALERRLRDLAPEARRTLRAASIFPHAFWPSAVRAVLGASDGATDDDVRDWLVLFSQKDLLTFRATSGPLGPIEFRFRNDLMRKLLYGMLTPADLLLAHRSAARWFARAVPDGKLEAAYHFRLSGDLAEAADLLTEVAAGAHAKRDAKSTLPHCREALALGVPFSRKVECLQMLGHSLVAISEYGAANRVTVELLALVAYGTQAWLDAITTHLSVLRHTDEIEYRRAADDVLRVLPLRPELVPEPHGLSAIFSAAVQLGNSPEAKACLDIIAPRVLAAYPGPGARAQVLRAYSWIAMFESDVARCLELDTEGLECAVAAGDQIQACWSRFDLAYDAQLLGEYEAAERSYRASRLDASRLGLVTLTFAIDHNLAFVIHRLGRSDEGIALQERVLEYAIARSSGVVALNARLYLAMMFFECGRPQEAEAKCLEILRDGSYGNLSLGAAALLSDIALSAGETTLALARVDPISRRLEAGETIEEHDLYVRAIRAAVYAKARHPDFRRLVDADLAIVRARANKVRNRRMKLAFLRRLEVRRLIELGGLSEANFLA